MVVVCIIYILVGLSIHNYKETYGHSPWIHESSIACIFGLLVGGLVKYFTGVAITFDNTLFFYLVLPPIIFSAGFSLKRKRFFQYIHQIMFFGVVGTVIDVLLIAVGAIAYSRMTNQIDLELSWNQALLFASVLAGSDEVSAMSLIKIKDFPRMGALIFGEGVINDALSIVLFKTYLPLYNAEMAAATMQPGATGTPVNTPTETVSVYASIMLIGGNIVFQVVCSWAIGMGCGLANARLMKALPSTKKFPISQTALVLLFGYLAYAIAEATGVSGILTLFIVAITLAHYSWYSLSSAAKIATRISFAGMADIAEAFAFSYVGLSLWGFDAAREFHFAFAFYMLAVVLLARCVTVFGLFFLCQRCRLRSFDIPLGEQAGFALGGIVRGCLCWAQILQVKGFPVLVTSTLIVVMTTLLAGGVLLPMVIPNLGLTPSTGGKAAATAEALSMLAVGTGQQGKGANVSGAHRDAAADHTLWYGAERGLSPETTLGADEHEQYAIGAQQNQHPRLQSHMYYQSGGGEGGGGGDGQFADSESFANLSPATDFDADGAVPPAVTLSSLIYVQWVRLDEALLKPLFGGSSADARRSQLLLQETSNLTFYSRARRTPPGPTPMRGSGLIHGYVGDGTPALEGAYSAVSQSSGDRGVHRTGGPISRYGDLEFSDEERPVNSGRMLFGATTARNQWAGAAPKSATGAGRFGHHPHDLGGDICEWEDEDLGQISGELNRLADRQVSLRRALDGDSGAEDDPNNDIVLDDDDAGFCGISSPLRGEGRLLQGPESHISPASSSLSLSSPSPMRVDVTPIRRAPAAGGMVVQLGPTRYAGGEATVENAD